MYSLRWREGSPWVINSPVPIRAGGNRGPYTITADGVTTVGSPVAKMYVNNSDKTSTYLSGSATAANNVITTPTLIALKGPMKYVLAIECLLDGIPEVILVQFNCSAAGSVQ